MSIHCNNELKSAQASAKKTSQASVQSRLKSPAIPKMKSVVTSGGNPLFETQANGSKVLGSNRGGGNNTPDKRFRSPIKSARPSAGV